MYKIDSVWYLVGGVIILGLTMSELRVFSLILQIVALLLIIIGFIALKKSTSMKEGISKHGKIINVGYSLAILSVLYMAYSAYLSIIGTGSIPPLVLVHGSLGIITLALGALFVTNRWSWKSKRYMRIELVLWLAVFLGGTYLYLVISGAI
ncbi:hypothetical protein C7960_1102 [Methanohalophilus euhalobius]|jgi:uncharacterized membrane protein YozB (DUF420 family)|uniref:DUF420 domain-containing protein n=1 Tax=Methanohalophilus euhalobius TaxID=51203 RepID=A0A285G1A9_9EURY|nr:MULTISPECIES: hypothetical protein [Methanohalophilus]ODV49653.1 MAG: hypothetical protein A8273_1074 [Methanohalophilus sp. 2-GBenrich]RSD34935.1 MAG: hypothetical protein CI952_1138 [Methanohalophilus sp.]TCL11900.1 hypothetical protein C7960_1102 [Methanohalophilus euhalobius]SNY17305.1 hypothetical protein SAMN06295989_10747 [Methanohalophilus euhalobius]